jgi:hypothetical protein
MLSQNNRGTASSAHRRKKAKDVYRNEDTRRSLSGNGGSDSGN